MPHREVRRCPQDPGKSTERRSVVTNLIEYFDPIHVPSTSYPGTVNGAALDRYLFLNEKGERAYGLSAEQRAAFAALLGRGPISLLQGPPGTGKTSFIAAFVHYVLTEGGATNVLLVSQAHHAVNNVVKAVRSVFDNLGNSASIVRFGPEGMLSRETLDVHPAALLRSWYSKFDDEFDNRIAALTSEFFLPEPFVRATAALFKQVAPLLEQIESLDSALQANSESDDDATHKRRLMRASRMRQILGRRCSAVGVDITDWDVPASARKRWSEIVQRLATQFDVENTSRVGTMSAVLFMVKDWIDQLRTGGGNFDEFLVRTKQIVVGTCVGIGQGHLQVYDRAFDWVVVDEAARATSGELAVALQSARRVLLVGDHKQLPPMLSPDAIDFARGTLGLEDSREIQKSDFERAFNAAGAVKASLTEQYRMVDAIGELVSECFYDSKLVTKRGGSPAWMERLPAPLNTKVSWLDTSSLGALAMERQEREGFSYYNTFEIECVVDLLKQLSELDEALIGLAEMAHKWTPIGVITTYALQRDRLLRTLAQQDWYEAFSRFVRVDTVDSYQGQENPIIILSTVRNNREGVTGFTSAEERVNVAMSRARERLLIVGAKSFFTRPRVAERPLGMVARFIDSRADGRSYATLAAQRPRLVTQS